jgi:molybdopterin converting factor small subunit
MSVPVTIPTPLRGYAGGQKTVSVEGATVGEALSALTIAYPNLRQHLFADDGKLRSFVNVYLNDEDVRYLKYVDTPLTANDTLAIVPSVAGGRQQTRAAQCCVSSESTDVNK